MSSEEVFTKTHNYIHGCLYLLHTIVLLRAEDLACLLDEMRLYCF